MLCYSFTRYLGPFHSLGVYISQGGHSESESLYPKPRPSLQTVTLTIPEALHRESAAFVWDLSVVVYLTDSLHCKLKHSS